MTKESNLRQQVTSMFIFCSSQNETLTILKDLIAKGEQKLNETMLSTKAADLKKEEREMLKREIMEDLAREQAAKERMQTDLQLNVNNETDVVRQLAELRRTVLANTQG